MASPKNSVSDIVSLLSLGTWARTGGHTLRSQTWGCPSSAVNRNSTLVEHPRARARLHLDRSVQWPRIRRQQPESVTAEATAHDPRAQGAGALQLVDGRLDRWGR